MRPTRRDVVRAALAGALSSLIAPGASARAGRVRFVGYPFMLGVASGYPQPNGFSLWTRLVPSPLDPDGGMGTDPVAVGWEVAEDEAFASVVARGRAVAYVEHAHSVHVDVIGLEPGRWYFYRFFAGAEASPVGRTRTADAPTAKVARLRFAVASCQHFEHGWYVAHRHLAAERLDLVLFVGDYIYEKTWGDDFVRAHAGGEAVTLDDYRVRHAQTKTDADLQRLHALVPWAVVWDDHEVDNDWAGDQSEHLDPQFLARRGAAFQAYLEHMPVPTRMRLEGGRVRLYEQLAFGDLARFYLLDDRQYRTAQACPDPAEGGGATVLPHSSCADLSREGRTMLGETQEAWFAEALDASKQRWNVVAQQTLMAPYAEGRGPDRRIWTDGWDGYPRSRKALLARLAKAQNPVVVGGDNHNSVVADLHADPEDLDTPIVASELCGTSITSQGGTKEDAAPVLRDNPHVRYTNGWQRGYVTFELTPGLCTANVRVVDAKDRASGVETVSTWVVESGKRGLEKA